MRDSYGVALPPNSTMVQGKGVSFIGYGPGQWLAVSATLPHEALAVDLATRLEGLASISDQSGGRAVLRLSGPRARDLLAKGLAIDLDPRVFPPGSAGDQHDFPYGRTALAGGRRARLRHRHFSQRLGEFLVLANGFRRRIWL